MTLTCSAHGGSRLFTAVFTRMLSNGRVRTLLSSHVAPAPMLSCTALRANYYTKIVVATSRGPPSCGNVGFGSHLKNPFGSSSAQGMRDCLCTSPVGHSTSGVRPVGFVPTCARRVRGLVSFREVGGTKLRLLTSDVKKTKLALVRRVLGTRGYPTSAVCSRTSRAFRKQLTRPVRGGLLPLGGTLGRKSFTFNMTASKSTSEMKMYLSANR